MTADKQCSFCGNIHFRDVKTDYIYRHDGQMMLVHQVPCEECEFCGEQYFEAIVLERIEADFFAIQRGEKKTEEIRIPVEAYEG